MGIVRSGSWVKVTSGGSVNLLAVPSDLYSARVWRVGRSHRTDWVLVSEFEEQSECLVEVERVVVEHLHIEVPLVEVFRRHESDASR